jgi:galactokinase
VPALDDAFVRIFGRLPEFRAQAPGRVNLIGEHTDYNDGLVMPLAIGRSVTVAAARNGSPDIRLYSTVFDSLVEFPVAAPAAPALPAWARYAQGVAAGLIGRGVMLRGLDAAIGNDLPIGAGLSSSAALEVASALVFERSAGVSLSPRDRAHLCHEAEVSFVGVPCGIMDQFTSSLARAGHALFLDCRTLETHHIPLPPGVVIAVCDTGVRRTVGETAYGARRRECEAAVRWLVDRGRDARTLRDLALGDLPAGGAMPDRLRRRARHVVTENARVIESARALEGGDLAALRGIFLASHASLRDDYEVGHPDLDAMVAAALDAPGCLAARMTGAGFGGAVVALVQRAHAEQFLPVAAQIYRQRSGRRGEFFTSEAADGAQLSPL